MKGYTLASIWMKTPRWLNTLPIPEQTKRIKRFGIRPITTHPITARAHHFISFTQRSPTHPILALVLDEDMKSSQKLFWKENQYATRHPWMCLYNPEPWHQSAINSNLDGSPRVFASGPFISWLSCRGTLATKDRLRRWGIAIDAECVLCSQHEESLQHLFFDCSFSKQIWNAVLGKFMIQRGARQWDVELIWACDHCNGKSFRAMLFKLFLAAASYYIWLERNARIFGACFKDSSMVLAIVE